MKKLNVIVRDKNTLVLEENGEKGDYIDLSTLNNVDFSQIEEIIEQGKDITYQKKISEALTSLETQKNLEIAKLKSDNENALQLLKSNLEMTHSEKIHQLTDDKTRQINELKEKISISEKTYNANLESEKQKLINEYQNKLNQQKNEYELQINTLNSQIKSLESNADIKLENEKNKLAAQYENTISNLNLKLQANQIEFNNKMNEIKLANDKVLQEKTEQIKEAEDKYNTLARRKSEFNVKQIGEDLESWCNNEMVSYMQNGFTNCRWNKDNEVVKNEDEFKGSKADFIFKIYASDQCLDEELLTSVCLDMKDEDPNSKNKKKNSDYYKDLDKNRTKKNCKYAVLVSNLELDKPNDLPIMKVREYEDMYVVRPSYMVTFLNMVVSLTNKFKNLLLSDIKAREELKSQEELMEEFARLKETYLDKPLESLRKNIDELSSSNESIIKSARKIEDIIEKIKKSYLESIDAKISKFDISINKAYRKADK